MQKLIKKRPLLLFPILLGAYPAISALLTNIHEVPLHVLWRPLFLSLGCALALLLLLWGLRRDWVQAALLAGFIILLCASFGQVHDALTSLHALRRQAWLYPLMGAVWLAGFILGLRWLLCLQAGNTLLWALNAGTAVLVAIPLVQIAIFEARPAFKPAFPQDWLPAVQAQPAPTGQPDVYYIILDGYARADFMEIKTRYDNSGFVDELRSRGFYVGDCSRTNYGNTIMALTSSLNMTYLPRLQELSKSQGLAGSTWQYLKPNLVMQTFQSLGYTTLAFDSGYYWSSMENVDLYLQPWQDPGDPPYMTPFEYLLLKGTPLLALYDRAGGPTPTPLDDLLFPWRYHVAQQEYILATLPSIAAIDAPTFTFAHIMIPHEPMVFSPDGLMTNPLYFAGGGNWPRTANTYQKAYVNGVKYVNPRLLELVDRILADSATPPIILLQGDHGFWTGTNLPILNAYYLPGDGADLLFPTISPINTFRLIFDQYFGSSLGLMADVSFLAKDPRAPVAEELADCQP